MRRKICFNSFNPGTTTEPIDIKYACVRTLKYWLWMQNERHFLCMSSMWATVPNVCFFIHVCMSVEYLDVCIGLFPIVNRNIQCRKSWKQHKVRYELFLNSPLCHAPLPVLNCWSTCGYFSIFLQVQAPAHYKRTIYLFSFFRHQKSKKQQTKMILVRFILFFSWVAQGKVYVLFFIHYRPYLILPFDVT